MPAATPPPFKVTVASSVALSATGADKLPSGTSWGAFVIRLLRPVSDIRLLSRQRRGAWGISRPVCQAIAGSDAHG
jgi:hypothetical protein